MILAYDKDDNVIKATREAEGFCLLCKERLIPRMGDQNIHHWAHKSGDCDSWGGDESKWHLEWKEKFDLCNCEKVIKGHRADVLIDDCVLEIQRSPIDEKTIIEREVFYRKEVGNIKWLFDYSTQKMDMYYLPPTDPLYVAGTVLVTWKRPRQPPLKAVQDLYFEAGGSIFRIWQWTTSKYRSRYVNDYGQEFESEPRIAMLWCKEYTKAEFIKDCFTVDDNINKKYVTSFNGLYRKECSKEIISGEAYELLVSKYR